MKLLSSLTSRLPLATAIAAALIAAPLIASPAEAAGPLTSATVVTASATTVPSGTAVTLTAKVSVLGTGLVLTPSGSVTFTTGSQTLGTATLGSPCLLSACTATITTSALPVGVDTVVAGYAGDLLAKASSGSVDITVTQPPSAPQGLSASAGNQQVALSWNAPASPGSSAVTGYTVYRATTSGGAGSAVGSPSGTSFVDTGLSNGTTYYYTVVAHNATDSGPRSNEVGATPQLPVPGAPTLTASSGVSTIGLSWSSSDPTVTSYALYRATSLSGSYSQIASGLPSGSYQDTTVQIGVTYYYKATVSNAGGESPYSNTASAAATSYAGASSYSTTSCTANTTCSSPTVTATAPDGTVTTGSISTDASSASHTATVAAAPGVLSGANCVIPGGGMGLTFNDTSADAGKTVVWRITGPESQNWVNQYALNAYAPIGCIGLGAPWNDGSVSSVWNASDGLYEAPIRVCAVTGGVRPCYDAQTSATYWQMTVHFDPGDGRISGGY